MNANITEKDQACIDEVRATLELYDIEPETRNSDELDFHDLPVWVLRQMLTAAYQAGERAGEANQ